MKITHWPEHCSFMPMSRGTYLFIYFACDMPNTIKKF